MVCADHVNLWWELLIPLLKHTNEFYLSLKSMCDRCQHLGSGLRLALLIVRILDALVHILSEGAEVAGTARYKCASLARYGYFS
jgi:hypothetical protein